MHGSSSLPEPPPLAGPSTHHPALSRAAAPPSAKRSRSATADVDATDPDASPAPVKVKRKRNRAALSCSACKKRKIKCDRKLPCEACIKRGEQGTCRWEQPKVEPPPQPFALAVEHEQLKQRVAILEAVLQRLAPDVYHEIALDMPVLPVPPRPVPAPVPAKVESAMEEEDEDEDDDERESDGENVEDAALVLEELAMMQHTATRMSSRSRTKTTRQSSTPRVSQERPVLPVPPPLPSNLPLPPTHQPPAPTAAFLPVPLEPPRPSLEEAHYDLPSRAMASLLVPSIDPRRQRVLLDIFANLPQRKSEIDWMLRNYFDRVDWAWHLHHKPTFEAEYDAFCILRAEGRLAEIDPLWVACLAMTLSLSVNSLSAPVSTPLMSISAADLESLPWRYFECAQSALECGDWTGKPRFRTLQAIVLFAPFFLFAGNRASAERHQTYIGAALRMAQSMGLHALGDDPHKMPVLADDDELYSGLPPGVNSLKREMALRMLATLLFLDYTSLRIKTSLPPHLVTSALPGNYNDADLSPTSVVAPRPVHQATDVSLDLVKFRLALEQRKFKVMMEGKETFSYEAVAAIDANYRAILDSLPTELAEGYIPPLGEPLTSLWRRNMAVQSVQSRILRLHRPWLGRGWTSARYAESTAKALASARSILQCQVSLNSAPMLKQGFQLLTVQMAVVALFTSLFHSIAHPSPSASPSSSASPSLVTPRPTQQDDDDLALITSTLPYLTKHTSSRIAAVRTVASSSLAAFRLLLRAYERRKDGTASAHERAMAFDDLIGQVGRTLERAERAGVDPLVAAEAELDGHEGGFVDPAAVLGGGAGGGDGVGSLFGRGGGGAGDEESLAWEGEYSLSQDQPDLDDKFDLAVLEGPEYADPTFSWNSRTALGQFASLGTF
ncbi:uncharacterized protein RHOBADRAFT_53623 [Rhodotorula graminis WP1]|uniref:Zn(2)-C6 fungal-type domain-containing protein n=1 Tax=Rhodotorula graminis (strain WP1) TaxID=578459 RepID=A0A194S5H2_RHOGW|nr:uncharacterized protein RHOBADRAFT_53623 [Rhodotorula graminis WP1]KPV74666.1 hypothetical protein RHOBADRAFT_53623 [Rhodotorula graminis WP1]